MREDIKNTAAWKLQQAMAYRGVNVTELSKKMNVSRQSIYRIMNQETDDNLRMGTLRKLADALDCGVEITLTTKGKERRGKKVF